MTRTDAAGHLTDEQRAVLEQQGEEITVHAGAGTGKTRLLVEWYLHQILEHGVSPQQILAITFTRKAAAEMRERIVRRLFEQGRREDARLAQVGPISTVHSLCERLLREYPIEAGVDPRFKVLDGSSDLTRECVQRAIAQSDLSTEEIATIRRFAGKRSGEFGGIDGTAAWLIDQTRSLLEAWRQAAYSMEELEELTQSPNSFQSHIREIVQHLLEEALGEKIEQKWWEDFDSVRRAFSKKRRTCPLHLQTKEKEEENANLLIGVLGLALRAWRHLEAEFAASAVLDFVALERRAVQLLEKHGSALRGKYICLAVDEAQDLNRIQYRLLRALPVERRLFVGDPQQSIYFFRGADSRLFEEQLQQSACCVLRVNHRSTGRILRAVETTLQSEWGPRFSPLQCGRGTPQAPRPDEEDVFEAIGTPLPDDGHPVELWKLPRGRDESIAAITEGVRELIEAEEVRASDITVVTPNRDRVDRLAARLSNLDIPVTILGTGRSYFLRSEIRDLGSALRALADPSDDYALLSLLRSPIVGLTFDGFLLVGLRARTMGGVYASLKQGVAGLSRADEQAVTAFLSWFTKLSPLAQQMPPLELLSLLARETNLDARFALRPERERLIANFRKLLKMARDRSHLSPGEFAAWLKTQQLARARVSDAETTSEDAEDAADAVRICNSHQAKGLEWPVVVLDAYATSKSARNEVLLDPDHPLPALATTELRSGVSDLVVKRMQERRDAEEMRLLYVSLTRAQDRLCIAFSPDNSRNRWLRCLKNLERASGDWIKVRSFGSERATEEPTTKSPPAPE